MSGESQPGAEVDLHVHVGPEPIDPGELQRRAGHAAAGAVVQFCGTVRNHHLGARVVGLEYEAYETMAAAAVRDIIREARGVWSCIRVGVVHRTGPLKIGDVALCVTVSAAHREEAFLVCRHIIDRLKDKAPIWKRETLASGEQRWIEASPSAERGS
jgi:molybdopterin synthase catalytic subunit